MGLQVTSAVLVKFRYSGLRQCVVWYLQIFQRTEAGKQKQMDSLTKTHLKLTNTRICPHLNIFFPSFYPSYVANNTILFAIIGHIKYKKRRRLITYDINIHTM